MGFSSSLIGSAAFASPALDTSNGFPMLPEVHPAALLALSDDLDLET